MIRWLSINSFGARVTLKTVGNSDFYNLWSYCDVSSRIIPGLKVKKEPGKSEADIVIRSQKSGWLVEMGGHHWSTKRLPDITSIAEGILESRRQLQFGVCAVHGSLVRKADKAILIVGGSDCGKTSLALELRKKNWDFLTDEKTLIRLPEGEVVGGRRTFRAQRHLVEEKLIHASENSWIQLDSWPSENPILTCVVFVNLLPQANEPVIWKISPEDACWELFPEFSRSISMPRNFGDFNSASAGFDSDHLASWRAAVTRQFCKRCEVLHLGGQADHAAATLDDVVSSFKRGNPIFQAFGYLRNCKTNEGYSLTTGGSTTTLSTCFSVLGLNLLSDTAIETSHWRREMVEKFEALFQPDTCLYEDPLLDPADVTSTLHPINYLQDQTDYFIRRALRSLGKNPRRNRFNPSKWNHGAVCSYLEHLNWSDPWLESNRTMFLLSKLEDEANWKDPLALNLREEALDWLEKNQDAETGLWGTNLGSGILRGVAGAYHLISFLLSSKRGVRHIEKIIESVLALEHPKGLFYPVSGGCACIDTDCVGLLAWLLPYTSIKQHIREVLKRTRNNIINLQLLDGGFPESGATSQERSNGAQEAQQDKLDQTWVTSTIIRYSSWNRMEYTTDASDSWSTYFRLLSIAFCDLALGTSTSVNWCLEAQPGLGWWPKVNEK